MTDPKQSCLFEEAGVSDTPAGRSAVRAHTMIGQLLHALGPGHHYVTCAAADPANPLQTSMEAETGKDGVTVRSGSLTELVVILAYAVLEDLPAGIITRSHAADDDVETVRGWSLDQRWLRPINAADVLRAYSVDPMTGRPIPPDPDVFYADGVPLPGPGEEPLYDTAVGDGDDGALPPQ